MLPIPVLDGGQLTLLDVEAIRGKPLPEKAENIIYTGGYAYRKGWEIVEKSFDKLLKKYPIIK